MEDQIFLLPDELCPGKSPAILRDCREKIIKKCTDAVFLFTFNSKIEL